MNGVSGVRRRWMKSQSRMALKTTFSPEWTERHLHPRNGPPGAVSAPLRHRTFSRVTKLTHNGHFRVEYERANVDNPYFPTTLKLERTARLRRLTYRQLLSRREDLSVLKRTRPDRKVSITLTRRGALLTAGAPHGTDRYLIPADSGGMDSRDRFAQEVEVRFGLCRTFFARRPPPRA